MQHFQNIFQKHALQIARQTINQIIIMKIDTCHVEYIKIPMYRVWDPVQGTI